VSPKFRIPKYGVPGIPESHKFSRRGRILLKLKRFVVKANCDLTVFRTRGYDDVVGKSPHVQSARNYPYCYVFLRKVEADSLQWWGDMCTL